MNTRKGKTKPLCLLLSSRHCTVFNVICRSINTYFVLSMNSAKKGRGACSSVPNSSLRLNNLKTGTCLSWLCCAIPAGYLEETCFPSSSLCIKLCCKTQNVKKLKLKSPSQKKNNRIGLCPCLLWVIQRANFLFLLIISLKQMTFMFHWYCLAVG